MPRDRQKRDCKDADEEDKVNEEGRTTTHFFDMILLKRSATRLNKSKECTELSGRAAGGADRRAEQAGARGASARVWAQNSP